MASAYDTLYNWARKTSSWAELKFLPAAKEEPAESCEGLIYKLKHWPDLPDGARTAPILRTLSVMSHRAVNKRWIMVTSKMASEQVDHLLRRLAAQDALVVTDTSHFTGMARLQTAIAAQQQAVY